MYSYRCQQWKTKIMCLLFSWMAYHLVARVRLLNSRDLMLFEQEKGVTLTMTRKHSIHVFHLMLNQGSTQQCYWTSQNGNLPNDFACVYQERKRRATVRFRNSFHNFFAPQIPRWSLILYAKWVLTFFLSLFFFFFPYLGYSLCNTVGWSEQSHSSG